MNRLVWILICSCLTTQKALAIAGVDVAPSPGPPAQTSFAKPAEVRLSNGLRVIVVTRGRLPLIAAQVVIGTGAEADPKERAGASDVTASLLTKGTLKMSAPQIATAIEILGGTIFSASGWDNSSAGVAVMSDKADPALEILADVVLHPTFKEDEVVRLKKQSLDNLRVEMQEPGVVADYARVQVVFPSGEYGHPRTGTLETVSAITRDDILKMYRTWYRPDNAVLLLVGAVSSEQGKAYAERYFGAWKAEGESTRRAGSTPATGWNPRRIAIDMSQAGQAAVLLARPMPKRASPDYYTGVVTNAALGSGFGSRLNREIRIKRGLSYGAASVFDARRDAGQFIATAQTKNESAADVARLMQSELKRLGTDPVQGDELKSRQAMLTGNFGRSMESNFGVAGQIAELLADDLPLDTLQTYVPSVNNVTTKAIAAFAKKYFEEPLGLVIVGKTSGFLGELKNVGDLQVIPQAELDLNRPELVKQK